MMGRPLDQYLQAHACGLCDEALSALSMPCTGQQQAGGRPATQQAEQSPLLGGLRKQSLSRAQSAVCKQVLCKSVMSTPSHGDLGIGLMERLAIKHFSTARVQV